MTRTRRAALAAAIVLLHGGAILLLSNAARLTSATHTEPPLTWIELAPAPPTTAPSPSHPQVRPRPAPETVALPSFPLPDLAPFLPQDGEAPLKDYARCALTKESLASPEERARCGKWQRDLAHGIGAPAGPTEREMWLAQKFSHDKAIQDAPILLPCFSPGGRVSVRCLLESVGNGFEMGSYADRHTVDR